MNTHNQKNQTWELTLTIEPARQIIKLMCTAHDEGQLSYEADPIMRAIAYQHPELVEEYSYLPWPHKP